MGSLIEPETKAQSEQWKRAGSQPPKKFKLARLCSLLFGIHVELYRLISCQKVELCIVKLGFTGVYIIFLIFANKHRLWVLVRTASPHNLCFE